jgi:putative intracellular protease/amidase
MVSMAAGLAGMGIAALAPTPSRAVDVTATEDLPENFGRWHGDERIAIIVYDGVSTLGLAAAMQVAALFHGGRRELIAVSAGPIMTELGWPIVPDNAAVDASAEPSAVLTDRLAGDRGHDLVILPGSASAAVLADTALIACIRALCSKARCLLAAGEGGLLLARAGRLDGCPVAARHGLHGAYGASRAKPVEAPVCVTPGLITAQSDCNLLDAGFAAMVQLRSPLYAKTMQVYAGHDPAPPYRLAAAPAVAREIAASLRSLEDEALTMTMHARAMR